MVVPKSQLSRKRISGSSKFWFLLTMQYRLDGDIQTFKLSGAKIQLAKKVVSI